MIIIKVYPVVVPISLGNLQTVNFYIVRNDHQILLIDAGNDDDDACWQQLNERLKTLNASIHDIDAILLTHNHTDHIGLVNRIRQINPTIGVYAPSIAIPRIQRDETFFHQRYDYYVSMFKYAGCGEDANERLAQLEKTTFTKQKPMIEGPLIAFDPGQQLFDFRIIDSAGHSPDHVLFHHESSNHAFVGDHFMAHSPSNAIVDIENDGTIFHSLIRYEQSLKHALTLKIELAYPGHGEPMTEPNAVIKQKLERINNKAERIYETLTKPKTMATIAKELYKDRYYHPQLFSLIMSEIIGHVDRLVSLGVVEKEYIDGVYVIKRRG